MPQHNSQTCGCSYAASLWIEIFVQTKKVKDCFHIDYLNALDANRLQSSVILTDYCGLGRELCQWKVHGSYTTWQTVSREETEDWKKELKSGLNVTNKAFEGTIMKMR